MTATTQSSEERIARLEQQVRDLAAFVGRVTSGVYGANFDDFDTYDDRLLRWHEEVDEPGTEDELLVGWWLYEPSAVDALKKDADA